MASRRSITAPPGRGSLGLRCGDNARRLLEAIESLRPQLSADTRFHLRHETYNLDAEAEIIEWLSDGRIDLFAFNDHMDGTVANLDKPQKRSRMVERTGLSNEAFDFLVERVVCRAHEVPASIARLAKAARDANVRMLSHDDESPEMRKAFRAQGVGIAEFPVNEETAREAAEAGDFIVFGAPNVVRGGSHTGWTKASDMIAKGLCSVLASDYYYPAQLLAAFRLAADGVLPLAEAWQLISSAPARPPASPIAAFLPPASAPTSSLSTTRCRCGRVSSPSWPRDAGASSPKPHRLQRPGRALSG